MNPTVQLLEPEVRELVQARRFAELRAALRDIPTADVAEILAALPPVEAAVAFRFLPRREAGEVFSYLDHEDQERLIRELGADGALRVVEAMEPDDRAELLDELPPQVAQRLLAALSPEHQRITRTILGYPPESVGRLMTPDYVRIRPDWSVAQAIEHIRRYGRDAETIHWAYVIDDRGVLIGDVHIRQLLLADPAASVADLMQRRVLALRATDDREEAVRVMAHYDRAALPVVDSSGVLLGIVTYDDVADVAEAEATEDFHKLAAIQTLRDPYLQIRLVQMIRKRAPWLVILFLAETVTILVLHHFDAQLQAAIVLASFIPLIIASGGNAATQAATLVTRALALRQIAVADVARVLQRELISGAALGGILGLLGLITVSALHAVGFAPTEAPLRLALAIALAVTAVVLWGCLLGSLFPIVLHRVGFDPAASSSPLVATVMDATGMVIYMTVVVAIFTAGD